MVDNKLRISATHFSAINNTHMTAMQGRNNTRATLNLNKKS
jgi:hypothetical protein